MWPGFPFFYPYPFAIANTSNMDPWVSLQWTIHEILKEGCGGTVQHNMPNGRSLIYEVPPDLRSN